MLGIDTGTRLISWFHRQDVQSEVEVQALKLEASGEGDRLGHAICSSLCVPHMVYNLGGFSGECWPYLTMTWSIWHVFSRFQSPGKHGNTRDVCPRVIICCLRQLRIVNSRAILVIQAKRPPTCGNPFSLERAMCSPKGKGIQTWL